MLKVILPLLILLLLPNITQTKFSWRTRTLTILVLTLISILSLPQTIHISQSLLLDNISLALISLSLWISSLIIIARIKIYQNSNSPNNFSSIVVILALILIIAFSANNLISFYIFFEASLIPTLLLILGWGYQPERLQAGAYLIIYTITASLPLLLIISLLYFYSGHISFLIPIQKIPLFSLYPSLLWIIFILAFLIKTPLFLTHLWLPKAHVEAPVAGSIILAGLLLKLGTFGLLRTASIFQALNKTLAPIIIRIALVGGTITRIICLRQTDIKALIAYSSVRHIGLATGGIITCTSWGWFGALAIIISHGLCSSALFALANITYETTHRRRIYINKGLLTLFPTITIWWFILVACNIAAPPSINLAREIILLTRALSLSIYTSFLIAILRFLAAAYSLILYTSTQHGNTPNFSNSLQLFTPRNYTTTLLHTLPLIAFIIKIDIISLWSWPYSWRTTLNCKFKSVALLRP